MQIRQYLDQSGAMEAYRSRWVASLDRNHSLGAPYWPESFWTDVRSRMQHTDLFPLYVRWYQHTVTAELMQQVLNNGKHFGRLGLEWSPAAFRLERTQNDARKEMDQLTLAETFRVIEDTYQADRLQIQAARARYVREHPEWKEQ